MTGPVTRRGWRGGLLAAAMVLALAACRQEPTAVPPLGGPLVRVQHAGGLQVDLPSDRVRAELTATGVRLRPLDAAQLRRPWTLDLSLQPGPAPQHEGGRDWTAGGRTLHQAPVRTSEGGSGGDEHLVDAWLPCGNGHVAARYRQQAESAAELDLVSAWQLVLASRCAASGR